jgi:hypothetical protein
MTDRSQAVVISCKESMRERIPVPVAAAANGRSPVDAVPKREPASGHRKQQTLKHCLQKEKKTVVILEHC